MSKTCDDSIMSAAFNIYKPPFESGPAGYIFDATGRMVADQAGGDCGKGAALRVRGWGRISYMDNPASLQDAIGEHIAEAMTQYWNKHSTHDTPEECPPPQEE